MEGRFIEFAKVSDINRIETSLKSNPKLINCIDNGKNTALTWAALRGDTETCKLLIENGADVNHENKSNQTALIMAASENEGHNETCKLLIEKRANVNHVDKNKWTALLYAADNGCTEICKLLIEKGANVNHENEFKKTSLIIAAIKGHIDICKLLIDNDANLNHEDISKMTALEHAKEKKHIDVNEFLFREACRNYKKVEKQLEREKIKIMRTLSDVKENTVSSDLLKDNLSSSFSINTLNRDLFDVKLIEWSSISSKGIEKLGSGSSSTVYKAIYLTDHSEKDVAIKIFNNSSSRYEEICRDANNETKVLMDLKSKMCEAIVTAHGIIEGDIPCALSERLNLNPGQKAIGIVMNYEGGGTLKDYLRDNKSKNNLSLLEKIRIARLLASGLAEVHVRNIVHGDLKSTNILMSDSNPPLVRLADFGVAEVNLTSNSLQESSIIKTSTHRGTRIYSAPEMLTDPNNCDGQIAKASYKTDIYAYAILLWEIFDDSKLNPFSDIHDEVALSVKVHGGHRPPLDALVEKDIPQEIIDMIKKCWDKDRKKRLTSVQCFCILDQLFNVLNKRKFDIFLSHAWDNKPVVYHIFYILTKFGFKVWFDACNMGHDLKESMINGIKESSIFICCWSICYQTRPNCLFELEKAVELNKKILTISLDNDIFGSSTQKIKDLCQISSKLFIDISNITSFPFTDTPSSTIINDSNDIGKFWYLKNPDNTLIDPSPDMISNLEKEFHKKKFIEIIKDLLKIL